MIQSIAFSALKKGPRLLVLGGVHGDERCGPEAIRQTVAAFERGELSLVCGRVTFVPVCNPLAYEQDKRFVDRNLNRFLFPKDEPVLYEERIENQLCPLLADCDALLDLHTYHIGGPPFVFIDQQERAAERAFACALGATDAVVGWTQAYLAQGRASDPMESSGTTENARRSGAVAVTLECGQHRDPAAVGVAARGIRLALTHFGLIHPTEAVVPPPPRVVRMERVVYKKRDGAFVKRWANFEAVQKDAPIAAYADGELLRATEDGVIVLPNPDCQLGEEWYYLGREEKRMPTAAR